MSLLRVRTVLTGVAGTPWYTNTYFSDPLTGTAEQDAVNAMGAFWNTMDTYIDNTVSGQVQGDVLRIDETDGTVLGLEAATPVAVAGGNTSDPLPYMTQGLGRLSTAGIVHNRLVRGRIIVPGPTEDQNGTAGVPASTYISTLQTAMDALIADANTALVVWSRPFAGTEGNPARSGSIHLVTGASVAPYWSVLRSRRD